MTSGPVCLFQPALRVISENTLLPDSVCHCTLTFRPVCLSRPELRVISEKTLLPDSVCHRTLTSGPVCSFQPALRVISEQAPLPVSVSQCTLTAYEATAGAIPKAVVIVISALTKPTGLGLPIGGFALALRRRAVGAGLCNTHSLPINTGLLSQTKTLTLGE